MIEELPKTGWDEFLRWGAKFHAHQCFGEDERQCKIRVVAPLKNTKGLLTALIRVAGQKEVSKIDVCAR